MYSMLSEKGKPLKVLDGHKFRKGGPTKNGQKWRCSRRGCQMVLLTDAAGDTLIQISLGSHNHNKDVYLPRQYIANSVKIKAANDIAAKPAELVRKEIREAPAGIRQQLTYKDVDAARRSTYRSRHSKIKATPSNIVDVPDEIFIDVSTHEPPRTKASYPKHEQIKQDLLEYESDHIEPWK